MEKQDNKSKAEERLGERFVSNEGYEFVIIEYNKCSDVIVKFADEHGAEVHTSYQKCKSGGVKNPYHPSVHGVGCLGIGDFKTRVGSKQTREYGLWHGMIGRCCNSGSKYATYANVAVCDRWLVYANFLEDLPLIDGYELWLNNPNERIALDKDLKQVGVENKVYSLETVCFITQSENSREMTERTKHTKAKKVICLETQQIFGYIKDAEQWLGKHGVSACCQGITKSAGGLHWMYLEDYKRQLRMNIDIKNSQLQPQERID